MSEEINNMNNEIKYAKQFHDLYEKYAPDFGYETRKDTKEFDPETPNGRLMTKVCNEVISQALQKRDEAIIKMLENTDVQMSVNGDVNKDEIAMAKFIYKAHIKHIIKKIESAIIPPNSINGTLPSETDSAIK